jgi:hypothetical protein
VAHELDNHYIFEAVDAKQSKSGKALKISTPSSILRIFSKDELKAQLEHYSHPMIKHTVLPRTPFARKHYVEKIRPALRFYCKKYGLAVPSWLSNDDYYKNLSDSEKHDLFGTTKLSFREFLPANKMENATVEQE